MSYNVSYGNSGNVFAGPQYIHQQQSTGFPNQQINPVDGSNSGFGHYNASSRQQPKNAFPNNPSTTANPSNFNPSISQANSVRDNYGHGYKVSQTANTNSHGGHTSNYNYPVHQQAFTQAQYNHTGEFNGSFNNTPQTWYNQTPSTNTQSSSVGQQQVSMQQYQQQQQFLMQQQQYLTVWQMAQLGVVGNHSNQHQQNQYKSPLPVGTKRDGPVTTNHTNSQQAGKSDPLSGNWLHAYDGNRTNNTLQDRVDKPEQNIQKSEPFQSRYNATGGQLNHVSFPQNLNTSSTFNPTTTGPQSIQQHVINPVQNNVSIGPTYSEKSQPSFRAATYPIANTMDQTTNAYIGQRTKDQTKKNDTMHGSHNGVPAAVSDQKSQHSHAPFTDPGRGEFPPFRFSQMNQIPVQILNNFQSSQNRNAPGAVMDHRMRGPPPPPITSTAPSGNQGPNFYPGHPKNDGPEIPPFPWQSRTVSNNDNKQWNHQQPWMGNQPHMNHDNWPPQDWMRFPPHNANNGWRGNMNNHSRFGMSPSQQKMNEPMYSSSSRQGRGQTKTNRSLWTPSGKKSFEEDKFEGEKKFSEDVDKGDKLDNSQVEVKAFLYAWLGKSHFKPTYAVEAVGDRPNETFKCELRADNFTYVGTGNAANKKDAQTLAAWDFVDFLVKEGQIAEHELPPREKTENGKLNDSNSEKSNDKEESDKTKSESKQKQPTSAKKDYSSKPSYSRTHKHQMGQHQHWRRPPEFMPPVRGRMMGGHPHMEFIPPLMGQPMFPPWEMHGPPRMMRPPIMQHGWGDMDGGWWPPMGPMPPRLYPHPHRPHMPGPHMHHSSQNDFWMLRDMEERRMDDMRQDWQHPEDMFIHKMILAQQQAEGVHKDPKGMDWIHPLSSKVRPMSTSDDRHIMTKHEAIVARPKQIDRIVQMTKMVEQSLKLLSDKFTEEDEPKTEKEENDGSETDESAEKKDDDKAENKEAESKNKIKILKRPDKELGKSDNDNRVLAGINRVGTLAQNLLIASDDTVQLILLCQDVPSKTLLDRIMESLPGILDDICKDKWLEVQSEPNKSGFVVQTSDTPKLKVEVTMTSTILEPKEETKKEKVESKEEREPDEDDVESEKSSEEQEDEEIIWSDDYLPKQMMLDALLWLRRDQWFQTKAYRVQTYQLSAIITRVLRDLQHNHNLWPGVSLWALNVLVFTFLTSSKEQMSPGDAFRRCFEVLAGGILLPGMPGIADPCMDNKVDVLHSLTEQEKLDITRQSQEYLRLIAFREIHKILKLSKISAGRTPEKQTPDSWLDAKDEKQIQDSSSDVPEEQQTHDSSLDVSEEKQTPDSSLVTPEEKQTPDSSLVTPEEKQTPDSSLVTPEEKQMQDSSLDSPEKATSTEQNLVEDEAVVQEPGNDTAEMTTDSANVAESKELVVDESAKVEEATPKISDNSAKVENEPAKLQDESSKLQDESSKLQDESPNLKDESANLEEESTKPKDESTKLEEESTKPEEESSKLKDESTKPEEESAKLEDESTKPQEESAKLEDESTKPEEESEKSDDVVKNIADLEINGNAKKVEEVISDVVNKAESASEVDTVAVQSEKENQSQPSSNECSEINATASQPITVTTTDYVAIVSTSSS